MVLKFAHYSVLRLLAGVLTVAVIFIQHFLPPRVFSIRPNPDFTGILYGHQHENGLSAYWIDEEKQHFHCEYLETDPYSCGYTLSLGPDATKGMDLSTYDGLRLKIKYIGVAPRIRLFMRDYDPKFDAGKDPNLTSKFMSVAIRTADLDGPTYVQLNEFSVGEWWIRDFDVPRAHAAPEYTNITSFGINFLFPGSNDIVVESVELVGVWIKKETLYLLIIVVWMILIFWEGFLKVYDLYLTSKSSTRRIDQLVSDYKNLEIEKQGFEALSTTDILTGVMNRAGVHQFLLKLFDGDLNKNNIGVLLFDIDHFKRVNDSFGHDVGDRILQGVAKLIGETTRQTDVFGRWGGEEFILICPQLPVDRLIAFAEKVRQTISDFTFELGAEPIKITISIGSTLARADETFEAILKRADVALYEAKNRGRNRVVFKEV